VTTLAEPGMGPRRVRPGMSLYSWASVGGADAAGDRSVRLVLWSADGARSLESQSGKVAGGLIQVRLGIPGTVSSGRYRASLEEWAGGKSVSSVDLGTVEIVAAGPATESRAALALNGDCGLAHFALVANRYKTFGHMGYWHDDDLESAWKAALDPKTAVAARALIALILIRQQNYRGAVAALSEAGPWESDSVSRNRLAFALLQLGEKRRAIELGRANLAVDPLDSFSRSILWLAKSETPSQTLADLVGGQADSVLGLVAEYDGLGHSDIAMRLCEEHYFPKTPRAAWDPLVCAWVSWLAGEGLAQTKHPGSLRTYLEVVNTNQAEFSLPYRIEDIDPLIHFHATSSVKKRAAEALLHAGHLRFQLGRYDDARQYWRRAAEGGASPVIAYRALGMAAKTLDGDLKTARDWLEKANQADPADAIVARDLANVLFALADQAKVDTEKRALLAQARDRLKAALESGRGRSDFVSLLARAQNRLGEFAETARLLDAVRVTVWEGAREVHDLFEEAHVALGQARLEAGRSAEALAEFNRALEYPENLATGKLENAREALIHYWRGNALAALGQKPAALEAWRKAADETASKDPKQEDARKKAREALDQRSN
jgi:tetratricopeptide (TPR) repeat protein